MRPALGVLDQIDQPLGAEHLELCLSSKRRAFVWLPIMVRMSGHCPCIKFINTWNTAISLARRQLQRWPCLSEATTADQPPQCHVHASSPRLVKRSRWTVNQAEIRADRLKGKISIGTVHGRGRPHLGLRQPGCDRTLVPLGNRCISRVGDPLQSGAHTGRPEQAGVCVPPVTKPVHITDLAGRGHDPGRCYGGLLSRGRSHLAGPPSHSCRPPFLCLACPYRPVVASSL